MKKLALAALLVAVAPLSAKSFDGAYVGLSGGYGITQQKAANKSLVAVRGLDGRIHAGYDQVFASQWLLGVEGYAGHTSQRSVKHTLGVNAKLGYVIDNVAFGGIVGWKNTKISDKRDIFAQNNMRKHRNALETGVFISTMLSDHIEFGGEYTRDMFKKSSDKKAGVSSKMAQDSFRLKLSYKI